MKTIPILINDRQIGTIKEIPPVITNVYNKWWKVYAIKKVYHNPGKSVVIETKPSLPYRMRTI
mgnify:CR=1 FL=1